MANDILAFVDGFGEVALKIKSGLVAVYHWDWGTEAGSREEWQRQLDSVALDLDVVVYFRDLPAKRVTVGFDAESPPEFEVVTTAVAAVIKHRDVDRAIPNIRDVAHSNQRVQRIVLS